jgi:AraC-like DNA-binding protein
VIEIGNRSLEVRAGSLVWFAPGIDHFLAKASDDFELITAGFAPELLASFAREHNHVPQFARSAQLLSESRCLNLQQVLRGLPLMAEPQRGEAIAIGLLHELSQLPMEHSRGLSGRAVTQVLCRPTITRAQLASKLGSNKGDVSRSFHRDHGVTLRAYRSTLRILHFLHRLESSPVNLTRAAFEAGFGSYSQCHRVFREVLGCSPREYLLENVRDSIVNQFEPLIHDI